MGDRSSQIQERSTKPTLTAKQSRKSPPPSQKANIDLLNKTIDNLKKETNADDDYNSVLEFLLNDTKLQEQLNKERTDKIEFQKYDTVQELRNLELGQETIYEALSKLESSYLSMEQQENLNSTLPIPLTQKTLEQSNLKEMSKKAHDRDYLFGLDIQTKNRYFPQIAVKNQLVGNTMVVPPNMKNDFVPLLHGQNNNEKKVDKKNQKKKSVSQLIKKFEVPHAGAWFERHSQPQNLFDNRITQIPEMDPAGFRIPKSYKLTHTEKIPELINTGSSANQIRQTIADKMNKTSQQHGNRSKVGMLISMHHPDPLKLRLALDRESYIRKIQTKDASDYNLGILSNKSSSVGASARARFQGPTLINEEHHDQGVGNIAAAHRTIYQGRSTENSYSESSRFTTTNELQYHPKQFPDFTPVRKYYKRKTQYSQWSDALYNNGVFFNPPVNGI